MTAINSELKWYLISGRLHLWQRGQHNISSLRLWLSASTLDNNLIFTTSKVGPPPILHHILNVSTASRIHNQPQVHLTTQVLFKMLNAVLCEAPKILCIFFVSFYLLMQWFLDNFASFRNTVNAYFDHDWVLSISSICMVNLDLQTTLYTVHTS